MSCCTVLFVHRIEVSSIADSTQPGARSPDPEKQRTSHDGATTQRSRTTDETAVSAPTPLGLASLRSSSPARSGSRGPRSRNSPTPRRLLHTQLYPNPSASPREHSTLFAARELLAFSSGWGHDGSQGLSQDAHHLPPTTVLVRCISQPLGLAVSLPPFVSPSAPRTDQTQPDQTQPSSLRFCIISSSVRTSASSNQEQRCAACNERITCTISTDRRRSW